MGQQMSQQSSAPADHSLQDTIGPTRLIQSDSTERYRGNLDSPDPVPGPRVFSGFIWEGSGLFSFPLGGQSKGVFSVGPLRINMEMQHACLYHKGLSKGYQGRSPAVVLRRSCPLRNRNCHCSSGWGSADQEVQRINMGEACRLRTDFPIHLWLRSIIRVSITVLFPIRFQAFPIPNSHPFFSNGCSLEIALEWCTLG